MNKIIIIIFHFFKDRPHPVIMTTQRYQQTEHTCKIFNLIHKNLNTVYRGTKYMKFHTC